jgi:hypothetical protein
MKGILILLQSLGIKIEPAEIERAFAEGKDILPKLAASFEELSARQKRIEEKLDRLIAERSEYAA